MAFVEDLSVFFSLDTPGAEPAVYQAASLVVLSDTEFFDDASGAVLAGEKVIRARAVDLPGFAANSTITVGGVAYKAAEPPRREHGVITAVLERAP